MIISMDFNKLKAYLAAGRGKVSDFIDQNQAETQAAKQGMTETQANIMQKLGISPERAQELAQQNVDIASQLGTSQGSIIKAPTAAEAVAESLVTPSQYGNILNVVKEEAPAIGSKITPTMEKLMKLYKKVPPSVK